MTSENTDFEDKKKRHESGDSTVSSDSSRNIPTPPDGGWGWLVVLASFINHVVVDGISYTFSVFYMVFLEYFGESKGKTALIGSLLTGFYLLTGPFASALVNRFGCRPVCVAGSIISCVAFMLCTVSTSVNHMMLTYGVMGGIGFGLIFLPSIISVSYYFERRRALATGIAVCGSGVGCLIFAPIGPLLTDTYDWQSSMFIIAAIILNCFASGMIMRPLDSPKKTRPRSKNIIDRFKEKFSKKSLEEVYREGEDENGHYPEESNKILIGVQEAKLARQEMLRDDDSVYDMNSLADSQSLLGGSRRQSESSRNRSRTNSMKKPPHLNCIKDIETLHVPNICVEESSDHEETDKQDVEDLVTKGNGHIPSQPLQNGSIPNENKQINGILRNKLLDNVIQGDNAIHRNKHTSTNVSTASSCPHGMFMINHPEEIDLEQGKEISSLVRTEDGKQMSHSDHNMSSGQPRNRKPVGNKIPEGVTKMDYMRPLYRKDIFYSGSIRHIPQFQSNPDVKTYVASITFVPGVVPPEKESCMWRCCCIPKVAKDILKEMLDISLLKNPVFLIACLAEICAFIGLFVPFVYLAPRAIEIGIDKTSAAFLLSVVGLTNTIGRVASGWLADFPHVNSLLLHNMALIFAGLACFCNMFCDSYALMCVFSAVFGLCVATFIALTTIILCDLVGLESLTNAFGLLTMVRGFSSIIGPPIAGYVYDGTGNYDISFHIGGVMLVISGLLYSLLHLPRFNRKLDKYEMDEEVFPDLPVPELPKMVLEFEVKNEENGKNTSNV